MFTRFSDLVPKLRGEYEAKCEGACIGIKGTACGQCKFNNKAQWNKFTVKNLYKWPKQRETMPKNFLNPSLEWKQNSFTCPLSYRDFRKNELLVSNAGLSLSLVPVLAPWVVLQVLRFSLPPQYFIFQFGLETEDKKSHLTECLLPINKSSVV